jgi:hypothetical protein
MDMKQMLLGAKLAKTGKKGKKDSSDLAFLAISGEPT